MIIGIFREAEFNRADQLLSSVTTVEMHIPTLRNQPIFKVVQSDVANQVGEQLLTYL